jgi:hypothetical protein
LNLDAVATSVISNCDELTQSALVRCAGAFFSRLVRHVASVSQLAVPSLRHVCIRVQAGNPIADELKLVLQPFVQTIASRLSSPVTLAPPSGSSASGADTVVDAADEDAAVEPPVAASVPLLDLSEEQLRQLYSDTAAADDATAADKSASACTVM